MTNAVPIATTAARANALRAMHLSPQILVLPNAWDAASAKAFEAAGFSAIATTSSGVAQALGYSDHEGAPPDEMLAAAARIIRAVSVPVTVDFEAGYGLAPRELVRRLVAIGAAGMNLEDSDHRGNARIVDAERQAEHLTNVRAACRAEGVPLVLNARVDTFVLRLGSPSEQLTEGIRRARLYRSSGADCIYPITLADPAMIADFVAACGVINVNLRPGGPLSLAQAASLGVRRVTYGGGLFRVAMTALENAAAQVKAEVPTR